MPWTRLIFQLKITVFYQMSLWIVGSDLSHWVEQATYTAVVNQAWVHPESFAKYSSSQPSCLLSTLITKPPKWLMYYT